MYFGTSAHGRLRLGECEAQPGQLAGGVRTRRTTRRSSDLAPRSSRPRRSMALYVPILLPGDKGPTPPRSLGDGSRGAGSSPRRSRSTTRTGSERSTRTFNWTPDLPGYTPGTDLTAEQYNEMEKQLASSAGEPATRWAGLRAPEVVRRPRPRQYKDAVGLAPFGSKLHVGSNRLASRRRSVGTKSRTPTGSPQVRPGTCPRTITVPLRRVDRDRLLGLAWRDRVQRPQVPARGLHAVRRGAELLGQPVIYYRSWTAQPLAAVDPQLCC